MTKCIPRRRKPRGPVPRSARGGAKRVASSAPRGNDLDRPRWWRGVPSPGLFDANIYKLTRFAIVVVEIGNVDPADACRPR